MTASRRDALKGISAAGALALVGGAGIGVGSETGDVPLAGSEPALTGVDGDAAVRIAHASPDAPNVDVLVDGDPAFTDVAFGEVTEYVTVPSGTYTVTVTAAGDPSTVAFEGDVTFDQAFQTVAAIGELTAGTFQPRVLTDYDLAQVRLVHASPDAPAVDVTADDGAVVLFDGVAFGDSTDFAGVPAGSYTLEVRPDTETNDGEVVATFEVELEGGKAYTAFAEGYLDPANAPVDAPFNLVVALDGAETIEAVCPPETPTPTATPKTTTERTTTKPTTETTTKRTPKTTTTKRTPKTTTTKRTPKPTTTTTKRTPKPTTTTTKPTTTKPTTTKPTTTKPTTTKPTTTKPTTTKPTKTTTSEPSLRPAVVSSGCDDDDGFVTATNPNDVPITVVVRARGEDEDEDLDPGETLEVDNLDDGPFQVQTFAEDSGQQIGSPQTGTIACGNDKAIHSPPPMSTEPPALATDWRLADGG